MTTIEKMARAMAAVDSSRDAECGADEYFTACREAYMDNARAALAAIAEPSEAVVGGMQSELPLHPNFARLAWRAGVAAALAE